MEDAVEPKDLEPWVRQALKPQITTAEKAVQKARIDVETQLRLLKDVVADLLQKSDKSSAEKRNDRAALKAAKAVNRMCLELQSLLSAAALGTPESYESFRQFSDATARLAADIARTRDSWIRYIRPYYILDMMSLNASVDKLRRLGDQAWATFGKEGSLLHSLEESRSRAEKIEVLESSLKKAVDERDRVVAEIKKLDRQIADVEREIASLSVTPKIAELRKTDKRLTELRGELLSSGFRRLGRPLRRLEDMAGRGEYPIPPEVREQLSSYLKRPFKTFLSEVEGYPALKSVLGSMREGVKRKKLVLKQREERKVLERIDNVTEKNALERIHREATELFAQRNELLQDPECVELVSTYKHQKRNLKDLRSKHADLERQSELVSEKVDTLNESLSQFAKETGVFAEKLTKKPVRLRVESAGVI